MSGCLHTAFERIGEIVTRFYRVGSIKTTFTLVCTTDVGDKVKVLYAIDGPLMTSDGGYLFTPEI